MSCSREGLKRYHTNISSKIDSKVCITFKGMKNEFMNPSLDLHFGKVRGSNTLSGEDFAVVGTPHHNNLYYIFLAHECGIEVTNLDMPYAKIVYKNKEFWFKTFSDERLRKIHLELVEGELIQAVHRARLIRCNATVWLYSNFPLDQATYVCTHS